jgi:hypothetical protein
VGGRNVANWRPLGDIIQTPANGRQPSLAGGGTRVEDQDE